MCSGPIFLPSFAEFEIVEISEIARGHTDRADAEAALQIVDAVEVDQALQRLAQRRGVVIALRLGAARRPKRRRWNAGSKETGHTEGSDQCRAGLVEQGAPAVTLGDGIPRHRRRNHLPEFLQPLHPRFARVAGNDRGVDGADRDAGNPFRLEIEMTQRLIGAGLVGTERAAALQNEHPLRLGRYRCWRWIGNIHHGIRSILKCDGTVASVRDGVNQRGGEAGSRGVYRGSDDARISVQNTLYLVFGA